MRTKAIFILSGAALFALTGTASAGPLSITSRTVIAPPQIQPEPVHYRKRYTRNYSRYYGGYRQYGYGYNPGAAVAGAALGLMTLPFAAAATGWPGYGYYGGPYYGYYGAPYYGGYPY
ncbi:MAG: hypothetical protein L0Y57_14480 [Beijerinckiaceae bacterium]|nr:hypothetical protein [Beijerinckiaceae bacterium]